MESTLMQLSRVLLVLKPMLYYGSCVLVTSIVLFIIYRWIKWILSPLRQLPGPKGRHLPTGNLAEILREPLFDAPKRWWKEAGVDAPLIHHTALLWRPTLMILDKDIVKSILANSSYGKESPRFIKRVQAIKDTIGEGLVTVQGLDWARHRRILQPAFNTKFLKQALTVAVPWRVEKLIQCWKPAANKDWEIEVSSHLSALTLDIVGEVAFSHNFCALKTLESWSQQVQKENETSGDKSADKDDRIKEIALTEVGDKLLSCFTELVRIDLLTIFCVMLNFDKLNWYINPHVRKFRNFLDREVDKVVAHAQKETTQARSLLHLLLQARDPNPIKGTNNMQVKQDELGPQGGGGRLSDSDLRDEVKTFMIAGHETTSNWLHWALYALVKYPDVQERLYAEVVKHTGALDRGNNEKEAQKITLEQTEEMEYLGAFLQEVLRLYPPIGVYFRFNAVQERWHGVTIPPKTRLAISPYLLHRHPKHWDDPERFWPERWINVTAEEMERRRFAFIPFFAGGRNCKFKSSIDIMYLS